MNPSRSAAHTNGVAATTASGRRAHKRGRGGGAGARGRRTHDRRTHDGAGASADAHTTTWHTDWCEADDHSAPGPKGAATLCPGCGDKFAKGDVPPQKDPATGKFPCRVEGCGAEFDSEGALRSHRRDAAWKSTVTASARWRGVTKLT